jgi:hypothetical protein
LVYGTLLAGAWLLDAIGDPVTAATLRAKINYLEQLKEPLAYIKDNVAANVTFWCALLGLAYPIYKRHRADLATQVTTRVQSEFERLKGELDRGEWADLPPTEEMARIREQLERLRG